MQIRRTRRRLPKDTGYAQREYGVTDKELDAFVRRLKAENARERRAGTLRLYTGDWKAAIRD
jgi:hypothetical protein